MQTGTGKTVCVSTGVMSNVDEATTATLVINFSSQTSSIATQTVGCLYAVANIHMYIYC